RSPLCHLCWTDSRSWWPWRPTHKHSSSGRVWKSGSSGSSHHSLHIRWNHARNCSIGNHSRHSRKTSCHHGTHLLPHLAGIILLPQTLLLKAVCRPRKLVKSIVEVVCLVRPWFPPWLCVRVGNVSLQRQFRQWT